MDIKVPGGQQVVFDLGELSGFSSVSDYSLSGSDAGLFGITPDGLVYFLEEPDVSSAGLDVQIQSGGNIVQELTVHVTERVSFLTPDNTSSFSDERFVDALLHGPTGAGGAAKWGDSVEETLADGIPLVLTWSGNTSEGPLTDEQVEAIQSAYDVWAQYVNIEFVYVDEVANPDLTTHHRVFFQDQFNTGEAFPGGFLGGESEFEGDIFMQIGLLDDLLEDEATFGLHILVHEIGHSVFTFTDTARENGLDDQSIPWQFNNHGYTINSYIQQQTNLSQITLEGVVPGILDVKAAQLVYGANEELGAGDTTYEIDETTHITVWDVSGTDTLDFSGTSAGIDIDLRAYTPNVVVDNGYLGIADDVVLENVIGTDFDDVFRVNGADNDVSLGDGDDRVTHVAAGDSVDGGAGFDTVVVDALGADLSVSATSSGHVVTLSDGTIDLSGVEELVYLDGRINLSDTAIAAERDGEAAATYVSIDTSSFDYDLWQVDATDAVGDVAVAGTAAGATIDAPDLGLGFASLDGEGGVRVNGALSDATVMVRQVGVGDQTVHLSGAADNVYTIDLTTAPGRIDIYDYEGTDQLILDNYDDYQITGAVIEDGNIRLTISQGDTETHQIVMHNTELYGYVETVTFRSSDGDTEYTILPTDQVLSLASFREDGGNTPEFALDGVNYLVPTLALGEGLYAASANRTQNSDAIALNHLEIGDRVVPFANGDHLIFGTELSTGLFARSGNDIVVGGESGDRIHGGFHDDTLYGGDGSDELNGDFTPFTAFEDYPEGHDVIYAGDGDDIARGHVGNDYIDLGDGDDDADGTNEFGDDTILGGAGNDRVFGGEGEDSLLGGAGNDELNGQEGHDKLYAGIGDDNVRGGAGSDWIELGDGDDVSDGLDELGDDTILGGAGNDRVLGGVGNDYIDLGDGDDDADGINELGNDTILGGAGNDRVWGGEGDDSLLGGSGDDDVIGDEGRDTLYAGSGDDFVRGGAGNDYIDLGDGDDVADGVGDSGNDTILGGAGNDQVQGGDGNDLLDGGPGLDRFNGGDGFDTVTYASSGQAISVGTDLNSSFRRYLVTNEAGTEIVDEAERIVGTDFNDTFNGREFDETFVGRDGNDIFNTAGGNDQIFAGSGNDRAMGGDGRDVIFGGAGNDFVDGGNGRDTLGGGDGDDTIMANSADTVYAGNDNDLIMGSGSGDAVLWAGLGDDTVIGTDGANMIGARDGDDLVRAGGGNDTVFGAAGADTIDGQAGDDILWSGTGDDVITGGAGADTFAFDSGHGDDRVTDFNATDDVLLLGGVAAQFASFNDVLASSSAQNGGVLIDLGDDNSVFLEDITLDDLTAANVMI